MDEGQESRTAGHNCGVAYAWEGTVGRQFAGARGALFRVNSKVHPLESECRF